MGSQKPGHASVGEISIRHLYEIALIKQKDSPHVPIESVCKNLIGSARAMGVKVVDDREQQQA